MDKQIHDLSTRNNRKKHLKRGIALLAVVVMMFTVDMLKRSAHTMRADSVPYCESVEHEHDETCYDGDELICRQDEHTHEEACFDEPDEVENGAESARDDAAGEAMDGDSAVIGDVDEAAEELIFDLNYEDEDEEQAGEEIASANGMPEEERREYVHTLGKGTLLSKLILATGLPVNPGDVEEVGQSETADSPAGLILVEKVGGDYLITAGRDFDEAELAVFTADDILIVKLLNGTAAEAAAANSAEEAAPAEPAASGDVAEPQAAPAAGSAEGQPEAAADAGNDNAQPGDAAEAQDNDAANAQDGDTSSDTDTSSDVDAPAQAAAAADASDAAQGEDAIGEASDGAEDEDAPEGASDAAQGEDAEEGQDEAEAEDETKDEAEDKAEEEAEEKTEEEAEDEAEEEAEDEAEDEDSDEGEAEAEDAARVATIDLTGVEGYPLSLRALMAEANAADPEPAGEANAEETDAEAPAGEANAEDAAGEAEAPEAVALEDWTIEYDDSLLAVEPAAEDYLVMPLASFDEATVRVRDGGLCVLTLKNCAVPEEESSEDAPEEEDEASEEPGEPGDESAPTAHAATIDLTDVEQYPLSLRAMLEPGQASAPDGEEAAEANDAAESDAVDEGEPAEADGTASEGEADDANDAEPAVVRAPADWIIEYDAELLAVEAEGDDYLVTPIAPFESTTISVDDGSAHALTLINYAPASEDVEHPAQEFEARTETVIVTVSAPEGAFPAGTTMTVVDVEDDGTIESAAAEDFKEVKRIHAVDITFYDAEGVEIEPLAPISVSMAVEEEQIEENQDAVVVHVDAEGGAEVVAQSEGAEAEFSAGSFSVYAMVVRETIELKYIADGGETYKISVGYGEDAKIPEGATLAVEEVTNEDYLSQAEEALEGGKRITLARFFDIRIMDGETEVQPQAAVQVKVELMEAEDEPTAEANDAEDEHIITVGEPVACAMHFDGEEAPEVLQAKETEEDVAFRAESFSVWGVVYTVDFYYGNYEFHLPGEGTLTLSGLFELLGIEADAGQAEEVVFTNPELLAVRRIEEDVALSRVLAELGAEREGDEEAEDAQEDEIISAPDWLLVSLLPFDTEEALTVTMSDGTAYEIRVEDAQYYSTSTVTIDGVTFEKVRISELVNGQAYLICDTRNIDLNLHYAVNRDNGDSLPRLVPLNAGITFNCAWWKVEVVNKDAGLYRLYTGENDQKRYLDPSAWRPCSPNEAICKLEKPVNGDDFTVTIGAKEGAGHLYHNYNNGNYLVNDTSRSAYLFFLKPGYDVWFDGSNGVYLGDNGPNNGGNTLYWPNNTLYTRIDSSSRVNGELGRKFETHDVTTYQNGTVTLPTAADFGKTALQVPDLYVLNGWYNINANTGAGSYYAPGTTVPITQDTTFYADWFPEHYNIGQNANAFATTDTNKFIETHLFDYNSLFNMQSMALDPEKSSITQRGNRDWWVSNPSSDLDFLFLYAGAGEKVDDKKTGASMNPASRSDRNSSNEVSTDGRYFTGIVKTGMWGSKLKNALFSHSDSIGKRYVGSANFLYRYDDNSGYYYYDSDKHAASYNRGDGRFYVYNYTNSTNKSYKGNDEKNANEEFGDKADFLPFNYTPDANGRVLSETYGAVNYWFGMSSQIKFFLPNAVSGNNAGNPVNFSDHDKEMVYKFAGDDDVWVILDEGTQNEKLLLDLGGIHGKVYGEINFSRGTVTVAQGGMKLVRDDSILIDEGNGKTFGIIGYNSNQKLEGKGTVTTTPFSSEVSEGDHTLTLYYLERGASQSNCAIYFNIAPRYSLRFSKQVDQGDSAANVVFGVYTDPECRLAADLKDYWNPSVSTNRFQTGSDGIKHCTGLVAGRTYYIKELSPPAGYPDMKDIVLKLELDPHGKAMLTVPEEATWVLNTEGLTAVPDRENTYYLGKVDGDPNMYLLPVVNKKDTSITAKKVWALLDGKDYKTFDGKDIVKNTSAYARVKLQRYVLDDETGTPVGDHKVCLVTQYFANDNKPSRDDSMPCVRYRAKTYTVGDCGSLSFTLSTGSAGIYSVVDSTGTLDRNPGSSVSGPFKINGGSGYKPNSGTYSLQDIQCDAVIYVSIIGDADSESALMRNVALSEPSITAGTPRKIRKDDAFNQTPVDRNNQVLQEAGEDPGVAKLSYANGWTHSWDNLAAVDSSGHGFSYYVIEVGASSPQNGAQIDGGAFILTTSSDGLSSGTIQVNNTLQAVKVKLRKQDERTLNGKRVPVQGGEFYIYSEAQYNNGNPGTAMTPQDSLISSSEMGTPQGTKLQADELGRFYTGFLPVGTYYIVEQNAPDGYQQAATPVRTIKIVVSESGLACDMTGGDNLVAQKADSDGIYNLYIDNTVDTGSIKIEKRWASGDETLTLTSPVDGKTYVSFENDVEATAVLLSVGAIVESARTDGVTTAYRVDDALLGDVYAHPENYLLPAGQTFAQVVTVDGANYIRLNKQQDGTWPALEIGNLPLKQLAVVSVTSRGSTKNREQAVDGWYYLREVGYYYNDANEQEQLARVSEKTDNWTVTYGSTYAQSDHAVTIDAETYEVIRAKREAPDTLTVTNGFKGGYEFTKVREGGEALAGATFRIAVDSEGTNFIESGIGEGGLLTSDSAGKVVIPALPAGTYWVQEQSAPEGYERDQALYRLDIPCDGEPEFHLPEAWNGQFVNNHLVDVVIVKINETTRGDSPVRLSGAKFKLYKWGRASSESDPTWLPWPDEESCEFETSDAMGSDYGTLTIRNLGRGEYRLAETVSPEGYVLIEENDIFFQIASMGVIRHTEQNASDSATVIGESSLVDHVSYEVEGDTVTFTVGNAPGVALPSTGGPGTAPVYAAGAALILLAAALFLRKRREVR